MERRHALLVILQTVEYGRRIAQRDVGGDQFVGRLGVAMIAPLFKVAADDFFVSLKAELLVGCTTG